MTFQAISLKGERRTGTPKRKMTMTLRIRPFAAVIALALALPMTASAQTHSFSPDQRQEIGTIIREYLLTNPELLKEVISEMERREAAADAEKHRAAVAENATM